MRLLNVHTLRFGKEIVDNPPSYAIASHRWTHDETTFQEMEKEPEKRDINTAGYSKVAGFAEFVKLRLPHLNWLWIDTCCINKSNMTELQEAIISMCKWYHEADVCLAYLADVEAENDLAEFKKSDWFCRGWTLQELLAPRTVMFLTKTWRVIGYKGKTGRGISGIEMPSGASLTNAVMAASRIPEAVLNDFDQRDEYDVQERLAWMSGRATTLKEDLIYSQLGIFDVSLYVMYGEGYDKAKKRLLSAIHEEDAESNRPVILNHQMQSDAQNAIDRLLAPDPWSNHAAARKLHEPHTGSWLLGSEAYRKWKEGSLRHLWLSGKAGCGKTILTSSVVEDIRAHCRDLTDTGLAAFYFSFSDDRKQSYEHLLRSLVAQLAAGIGLSNLCRSLKCQNAVVPHTYKLEEILYESINSYCNIYLVLDALDECPETDDGLREVLRILEDLSNLTTNVKIFATSRHTLGIANSMGKIEAVPLEAAGRKINDDICKYVNTQLLSEARLRRLSDETKRSIADTLSQSADGMFRWAYCQICELRQMRSTKPDKIAAALAGLPESLDETYERTLLGMEECRAEALVLLTWLTYARRPPSLNELTEASIIDLDRDVVATNNRGSLEDTLDILAGLVVAEEVVIFTWVPTGNGTNNWREFTETRVRLAHYSVKEYLESERIKHSRVHQFQLAEAEGHRYLAQSCVLYLMHCSSSLATTSRNDHATFPLLRYAAMNWDYYSSRQSSCRYGREVALLTSDKAVRFWLRWCGSRSGIKERLEPGETRSPLYMASCLGLISVVQELLRCGPDINAKGGHFGTAIQAALVRGFSTIAEALIDAGADVNAHIDLCESALHGFSRQGREKAVRMLIKAGADLDSQDSVYRRRPL